MKVIKDNMVDRRARKADYIGVQTCVWCGSILEIDQRDMVCTINGNFGVFCPCCQHATAIKPVKCEAKPASSQQTAT